MRWVIGFTFAGFIGILTCSWVAAERARPQLIDVDPAAVQLNGSADPSLPHVKKHDEGHH
jgi:hypothetical protein